MAQGTFWSRSVRLALATMVVAALGAGRLAYAACSNCSFDAGAGSGSTGLNETGVGIDALNNGPDSGHDNSGFGFGALQFNTTGVENTATGSDALNSNTTGVNNTATGVGAMFFNDSGNQNTATGEGAMFDNLSGGDNTATGFDALFSNTTGNINTATGDGSLQNNTTGGSNVADGEGALFLNVAGNNNTALGTSSLVHSTGSGNIAVGQKAGMNLISGDQNIYIGNQGAAKESDTIRVGDPTIHSATFVAGVVGTPISKANASEVVIDANGQLGVKVSSARYKHDIRDMGSSSAKLMKLRPVSFRYKQDPDGGVQYGLIAEEVAPLYPELVTHGSDGKVQGVRYDLLPPMLLNEVQKLARDNERKDAQIATQQYQIDELVKRINALELRMSSGSDRLQSAMR